MIVTAVGTNVPVFALPEEAAPLVNDFGRAIPLDVEDGVVTAASIALRRLDMLRSSCTAPGQSRALWVVLRQSSQRSTSLALAVKHFVNSEPFECDQSQLPVIAICCRYEVSYVTQPEPSNS